MTDHDRLVSDILQSLHERAKELNCLYRVEGIINREDLSLEEIFRGVVEVIPSGWQYSRGLRRLYSLC